MSDALIHERSRSCVRPPDATVLIPVGRVDGHFEMALDSVLSQRGIDLEVLIVLDGILPPSRMKQLEHEWVSTYRSPVRRGVAAILNSALEHVASCYVARMDADDICAPDRLRKQLDYLLCNRDVALVGSWATVIDERNERTGSLRGPTSIEGVRKHLLVRNTIIHPSVMFRSEAVKSLGGYSPGLEGAEDYDLWLRLAAVADVAVIPEELISYRRHPGQVTHRRQISFSNQRRLLASKLALADSVGRSRMIAALMHWGVYFARLIRNTAKGLAHVRQA